MRWLDRSILATTEYAGFGGTTAAGAAAEGAGAGAAATAAGWEVGTLDEVLIPTSGSAALAGWRLIGRRIKGRATTAPRPMCCGT
jgi:hypothetical protein